MTSMHDIPPSLANAVPIPADELLLAALIREFAIKRDPIDEFAPSRSAHAVPTPDPGPPRATTVELEMDMSSIREVPPSPAYPAPIPAHQSVLLASIHEFAIKRDPTDDLDPGRSDRLVPIPAPISERE
jgi:hypothetical protein